MELIKILGIDPSLRNTGWSIIQFNSQTLETEILLSGVAQTYREKDRGILGVKAMISKMQSISEDKIFQDVADVVIEMPMIIFNARFAQGSIPPVAAIAGGCCAIFGAERSNLVLPTEWNKGSKKEKTQVAIQERFGDVENWKFLGKCGKTGYEHVLDATGIALWFLKVKYVIE
jgi:hypothetical protein